MKSYFGLSVKNCAQEKFISIEKWEIQSRFPDTALKFNHIKDNSCFIRLEQHVQLWCLQV